MIMSCEGFDAYDNDIITEANTSPVYEKVTPLTEIEKETEPEEVIYMNDVYRNEPVLHLPEWVIGKWRVRETGVIHEVTEAGFILSPEAALYPNPVTSGQFIEADGTSVEEVEENRYSIEASGMFLHQASGKKYSGSIKFEFIRDGDTITLNGNVVVKD